MTRLLDLQQILESFSVAELILAGCVAVLAVAVVVLAFFVRASYASRDKQRPSIVINLLPAGEDDETEIQPEPEQEEEIPTVADEVAVVADTEPVAVPIAAPDEGAEADTILSYNRSFSARLVQADDTLKEWYSAIKNEILSYERVTERMSWKRESFSYRRNAVAKILIKGKTLCLYLAVDPAKYADSKYKLEDVSEISAFADTPALYRIKSEKRVRYASELIAEICAELGSVKTDREPVDYYEPYCTTQNLINMGLVKRVVEDGNTAFIKRASEAEDDGELED